MNTSELDELIEIFEAEKANFKASLKAAVDEGDYLLADHCQMGLSLVREKLNVLYYFKDPHNQEKKSLERRIRWYESDTIIPGYFDEEIKEVKTRLKNLEDKPALVPPNENEITDALYDLIEGKNAGFRLHVLKEAGFSIEFRLISPTILFITFLRKAAYAVGNYELNLNWGALHRLGFAHNEALGSMECRYQLTGNNDVRAVKTLLARLLFEYSYHANHYDRPSTIEFL